jgi:hypothetical protein
MQENAYFIHIHVLSPLDVCIAFWRVVFESCTCFMGLCQERYVPVLFRQGASLNKRQRSSEVHSRWE